MHIGLHAKYPFYFNETWIFRTDFEKFSSIKFNKNPSIGATLFHGDGRTEQRRTDRHDEANSQFSQFFKSA